uniref:RNA/RNP complex-1-interacting phosphatase n=1 Tax=Lygus hesperus TaxID=30085 RepID=A0A0A9ZG81_LYGHE
MAPKEIPDRWEPYLPIGSPVRGTRFIALKVPLKEHVCAKLQPKFRWTVDILTDRYPDIGMIVDFTLTTRYYDYVDVLKKGVDYCKVAIPGQQIPAESLVKRFFAAVDFYLDKRRDDSLIGIHCTHGVNRTGYMIARYMIQRMGISVSDALESITVARGHPIERQNYISDLGRHLEQMPKVLDASDIHRGHLDGEPPRPSAGAKVVKKRKPMEPRMDEAGASTSREAFSSLF